MVSAALTMSTPVTPVRPSPFPTASRAAQPAQVDAARVAAQKAFFEMAMGKAAAPAAPAAAESIAPARTQRMPDPAAPAPEKLLRPGSLLDIRV
jgi:hypothetical protein